MKLSKTYSSKFGFTLLELLAVMLIMFMVMGIGTVAINGLLRGSGVSGAVSNIKAVLTQARQYAITKEKPVYVIFNKSGEKSSMTVCAQYGVSDGTALSGYCITEDPLPWGTNTLVGGTVYNLDEGTGVGVTEHLKVAAGGDKLRTPGMSWNKGDALGFEITDRRFLPSGMEFDDSSDKLTVIFNPDGTAGDGSGTYEIVFQEMYIANAIQHTMEVDKLTGWVKLKSP